MKKLFLVLIPALLVSCAAKESNTENPRGVYKMTKLIGKNGEIAAPFDQYQICTDSITMFAAIENDGQIYIAGRHYDHVLNYTGEYPKDSAKIRIYDSNSKGFTLKWWSEYYGHAFFPENDWCTEIYEKDLYSASAKPFFEVLMKSPESDGTDIPYLGTWKRIEHITSFRKENEEKTYTSKGETTVNAKDFLEELKNNKKSIDEMIANSKEQDLGFIVFSPTNKFTFSPASSSIMRGNSTNIQHNKDNSYVDEAVSVKVVWLSENCIATFDEIANVSMVDILYRCNEEKPLINLIASHYLPK